MNEWLGRIFAAWDNLSPRERLLVGGAGSALLAVLVWAAVLQPIAGATGSAAARSEGLEQQIEVMERLRRQYAEVHGRLAEVEQQIAKNTDQRGLRTLLSELAARSAVKIDTMEERTTPAGEQYRETKMEVSLKGVTLTQTINYLHNLESEERLLSVKSLRIKNAKTRGDGPDMLDVTFTVSAFDPV